MVVNFRGKDLNAAGVRVSGTKITATPDEINQVCDGVGLTATAANLTALTDVKDDLLAAVSGSGPAWLMSGEGSPVDTVTPVQQGAVYQDLTNGGLYVAVGATDEDWIAFGGVAGNIGEATGIVWNMNGGGRLLYLLGGERDTPPGSDVAYFGDAYSFWNGNSQGVYWAGSFVAVNGVPDIAGAALHVKTGASAEHDGVLQDVHGDMRVPGAVYATNGVILPTSDPHIVGALWNNGGTPAISTG